MFDNPRVSIIIPVYNGSNWLREAINSALAQTYAHLEVIVVNDGSEDGGETDRIAKSYGDRIRYIHQQSNGGASVALNVGIERMTGELFSWLSHDDEYAPDKIAKQVAALKQFGMPAVVFSDYCHIDSSSKVLRILRLSEKAERLPRCVLAIGQAVGYHGCSLLIPRMYFERFGNFNPGLRYCQDADMWFRMAGNVPFVHVKEVLVFSRKHDAQTSQTRQNEFLRECDKELNRMIRELSFEEIVQYFDRSLDEFAKKYTGRLALLENSARALLRHLGQMASESGMTSAARTVLQERIAMSDSLDATDRLWEHQLRPLIRKAKDKPRILVYNPTWTRGGIPRLLSVVFEALGVAYDCIFVTDVDGGEGFPLGPQIARICLPEASPERRAERLADLCALLDVDVFIGCPNYLDSFLNIYEKLTEAGIRSIACIFGHFFIPYIVEGARPSLVKRMEAFGFASVVTWMTSFGSQLYAQLNGNGAKIPAPNSFPKSRISPRDRKVVLAIGRFFDPVKRLDRVLKVFARVVRDHPDAELVVVGRCEMGAIIPRGRGESIGELASRLAIPSSRLHFAGEQEDVEPYYLQASVVILTSESEGMPMVLNEAGTFGLPCVVQEIAGLEDMISDGENGYVVPQGDTETMASRVSALLSDIDLRVRMGNRAYEMVDRFDRKRISGQWQELIDAVLTAGNRQELNRILATRFMESGGATSSAFVGQVVREYERNVVFMLESMEAKIKSGQEEVGQRVSDQIAVARAESIAYTQALQELTGSLSWRVTKPLRWGKKLYVSLRQHGVRATGRKVVRKVRQRFGV